MDIQSRKTQKANTLFDMRVAVKFLWPKLNVSICRKSGGPHRYTRHGKSERSKTYKRIQVDAQFELFMPFRS